MCLFIYSCMYMPTHLVATSEVETDTITQDRDSSGRDSTPTRESACAHESGAISEHEQEKEQETGRRDGEKGNWIFFYFVLGFVHVLAVGLWFSLEGLVESRRIRVRHVTRPCILLSYN